MEAGCCDGVFVDVETSAEAGEGAVDGVESTDWALDW
jgi:hypothetical protein